jgi:hypothetical protein
LWKLENAEGTWQQMLERKCLSYQVCAQAEVGQGSSHSWQSVNNIFQQYSEKEMHDGERALF